MKTGKKYSLLTCLWFCPLLSLLLLSSCSTTQQQRNTTLDRAISLHVTLAHNPKGTVDLRWSATTRELSVIITATGLAPNSTHPEHIHAGTCTSIPMGAIVYILNPLVADAQGDATSTTSIAGVKNGIPANGWYVNVHNGPTLNTNLEARAIACSNVNANDSSTRSNQQVHLNLVGTTAPDENAHGFAQIWREGDKIVVKLSVNGLTPNSTHMAHIHAGTCANQGAVVYPLQPVVANAQGDGSSTTTINNTKNFTTARLYINVHEAGTMSGMQTQQGFNPIICGNSG